MREKKVMATTAENLAGRVAGNQEKEKVEKRRALGRGLESLLPGPRVVAPAPVQNSGTGQQHVPHRAFGPVRNDIPEGERTSPDSQSPPFAKDAKDGPASDSSSSSSPVRVGDIQAVVEESETRAGAPAPHLQTLHECAAGHGASELRSDGQPGAAVPVQALPTRATLATSSTSPTQAASTQAPAANETITISAQAEAPARVPGTQVVNIALDLIDKNPYQTREVGDDDPLEELANSIKANGVMQPIVVRPGENGRYILGLGERRLQAAVKNCHA